MPTRLPVLPDMRCDEGCSECCGPFTVSEEEYRTVVAYAAEHGIEPVRQADLCPWFQRGRCQVYEARPFICKAFGHGDHPQLTCPRGYNTNVPLPELDEALRAQGRPTRLLVEVFYDRGEPFDAREHVPPMLRLAFERVRQKAGYPAEFPRRERTAT